MSLLLENLFATNIDYNLPGDTRTEQILFHPYGIEGYYDAYIPFAIPANSQINIVFDIDVSESIYETLYNTMIGDCSLFTEVIMQQFSHNYISYDSSGKIIVPYETVTNNRAPFQLILHANNTAKKRPYPPYALEIIINKYSSIRRTVGLIYDTTEKWLDNLYFIESRSETEVYILFYRKEKNVDVTHISIMSWHHGHYGHETIISRDDIDVIDVHEQFTVYIAKFLLCEKSLITIHTAATSDMFDNTIDSSDSCDSDDKISSINSSAIHGDNTTDLYAQFLDLQRSAHTQYERRTWHFYRLILNGEPPLLDI